jgi:Tfp pilus assembly protein PilO
MRHSVVSLRRRLDGRIYQVAQDDFFANERPLPPSTEISAWDMLELTAFLSEVERSFSTLERRPLPANEIPKLLKWVKQRAIARGDTLTPILMKSWKVIH